MLKVHFFYFNGGFNVRRIKKEPIYMKFNMSPIAKRRTKNYRDFLLASHTCHFEFALIRV